MTVKNPNSVSGDGRFHELLAEYLRRVDHGEDVDQAAFLSAHPEYAQALAEYFEGASVIENMAGPRVGPVDVLATAHGQADAETSSEGTRTPVMSAPRGTAASKQGQTDSSEQIPETFGRYKILKALGQGAMGAVYLAQDTQLQRKVALKIPKFSGAKTDDLLARFYREARAAALLRHPNICPVHDVGEIDGQHYITMAFIEGNPLNEFARAKKRQPEKNVAVVIRKLALGLAEAHAHGIIHRDLKPANIMVDTKGEPVVMDFGLARREEGDDKHVTREGAILGTPAYMSPEQVEGDQSKIGPPADIYSLGVVMYELLTGKVPFTGSLMSILMQIASEQPQPPALNRPGLDPRLETICLKMMAKRAKDRYGSMNEVAQALSEYLKSPASGASESVANTSASASVGNALRDIANESVDKAPSGSALLGVPNDRPLPVARRFETTPHAELPGIFTIVPDELHSPPIPSVSDDPSLAHSVSERRFHRLKRIPRSPWLAIGSGLAGVALLFAAVTLFIRLGKVDVKVVIHDKDLAVKFDTQTVTFEGSGAPIRVKPGERKFIVERDGLEFETDSFLVKKDGKNLLEVSLIDGHVVVTKDGQPSLVKRDRESGWHGWPKDAPPPAIAPFDAKQATQHQEAWAKYLKVPVEYTNSVGMKFRLIPPGEFLMGNTPGELDEALNRFGDVDAMRDWIQSSAPLHKVVLTHAIYLAAAEVTQAQYENVMRVNPSHFAATGAGKDAVVGMKTTSHPVEMLSWNDAAEYCAKLSQQEGLSPCYLRAGETVTALQGVGYRLPTEAEWEFACRAGTTSRYWSGDKEGASTAVGWSLTNSDNRTHAGGELKSNPFGLYDVHGNVWEYIEDWWGLTYYQQFVEQAAIDPRGPPTGSKRVIRGGYWGYSPFHCRSGARFDSFPNSRYRVYGARLVLSIDAVKDLLNHRAMHKWPVDAPPPAIAPFDAPKAKNHQEAWAKYLGVEMEFKNRGGMEFVLIPPGEYLMGDPTKQSVNSDDGSTRGHLFEAPQHRVILTQPIYLGVHEVTQAEYEKVMGKNPSYFAKKGPEKQYVERVGGLDTANHPVEGVSWTDAAAFCARLSEQEQLKPFYFRSGETVTMLEEGTGYRLPTEAEWEFACRAGTTTGFWTGDKGDDLTPAAWFSRNSEARTHAVGELRANPFGLFDMHGNVYEWMQDRASRDFYGQFVAKPAVDPVVPPAAGTTQVIRGGDWVRDADACRASAREARSPSSHYSDVGFRVVLVVDSVKAAAAEGKPKPAS